MSDNRTWAKIDTSYIMNPKWFHVERFIGERIKFANGKTDGTCYQLAITNALRTAREAHLASILYCAQNQTDGTFPVRAIKAIVSVTTADEETALTALFEVGIWINKPGGMAEVRDYLEHQTPALLTKKRSAAGKKGAATRWQNDGKSTQFANGKTMASANAEEKRREEKRDEGTQAAQPRKRGTRIPADFAVTEAMASWAHENTPHVNIQSSTARFVDYWTAASGSKATKIDWVATWRNWIRSDEERAPQAQKRTQTVSDDPYAYLPVIN